MTLPVPEHSVPLMSCLSGGEPLYEDGYWFFAADSWLMGIGYRDDGEPDDPDRFAATWTKVRRRVGAEDCFVMAPVLPKAMADHCVERDRFFVLPAGAEPPAKLRGPLARAADLLRVETSRYFSADHRRLWAEFLSRTPMNARVRRLYAATERLVREVPDVMLLNARDAAGRLVACLVLDFSLPHAVSYIIGAHSRSCYVPHASDLLFAAMLKEAEQAGKAHVLLGLGVNEGITRFKRKWGGLCAQAYEMAMWREAGEVGHIDELLKAMLAAPADLSKRQFFASLPEQKPFAMLWRLEKHGRTSWIGGTAHFFCCSFERSLRSLFERVDTVLFEGPLDPDSLDEVARHGCSPEPGSPRVADLLSDAEMTGLDRVVNGPCPRLARAFNASLAPPVDVRQRLAQTRPWYAFFSLWTAYLERNGWHNSVDMEAWNLAMDMGKSVLGMESLAEQIGSLESAPLPRIVRFMQHHKQWRQLKNSNEHAYLWGHLEGMLGTSAEFPTRTEFIIDVRDQRFRERMRPRLEAGGVAVFVGSAHMLNLRHMLAEDGFTVTRELPTWKHRLRAWWLRDAELVLRPAYYTDGAVTPVPSAVSSLAPLVAPSAKASAHATPLVPARSRVSGFGSGESLDWLTAEARVPEHLLHYVRSMATPSPILRECNGFAAWVSGPSLVLVGFDPDGPELPDFAGRLEEAVNRANAEPGIERVTVLSPLVPINAPPYAVVQQDQWWGIDLPAVHPQKLRNMISRAHRDITIRTEPWTVDHDALVSHYLHTRTDLSPGTRALFAALPVYVDHGAYALSARAHDGALAGFTLGDLSALRTAFYLFAFRSPVAPPGTPDALLAALARAASERGHTRLNLGLDINGGIGFFKRKWRPNPLGDHMETSWAVSGVQS